MSSYLIQPNDPKAAPVRVSGAQLEDVLCHVHLLAGAHAHIWENGVYLFSLEEDEAGIWHVSRSANPPPGSLSTAGDRGHSIWSVLAKPS